VLPRLRARSVTGEELTLPSFAYASARDPLDAHTLEAIAVGVTTRKYLRTLEPLRPDIPERAVSKSAVSRRFVALTSVRLTTWLAMPLDALDIRVVLIDGLHFRDHVILLAVGIDTQGTKHVLALREGTTENATVCKALLADLRERGLDLDRPTLFIIDGGTGLRKAIRETSGALGLVQRRAGLRLGELIGLQLEDLRLADRQADIRRTLGQDGAIGTPKSGCSRTVDLSAQLTEALGAIVARRKEDKLKHGWKEMPSWVFVTTTGTAYSQRNVLRDFKAVLKKAKLPTHFSPHSLRHTFASLHLLNGASVYYVQQQLGHASIKLTCDTYGKWLKMRDTAAADRLDSVPVSEPVSEGTGR
jgi:integrase